MIFMVMTVLERTQRFVREYHADQQSAWEALHHAGDRDGVARDIEELVDFGCFALRHWQKQIRSWDAQVSANPAFFDARTLESLESIQNTLVEAARSTLRLIEEAESWGRSVEQSDMFRQLSQQLFQLSGNASHAASGDFSELEHAARAEHRAGKTTPIRHWGE